jgi:hypothetical protein
MPSTAKSWTVAFVGNGDISQENAKELLDKQLLPIDAQVQALMPADIPRRGYKGLKVVEDLMEHEFDIPQRALLPADMIAQLLSAREEGEEVCLVILGTEDSDAVEAAEAALDAGIAVKDLCAALDDVEFEPEAEPEAEPEPPRRRGRPRKDATVTADVAGPATINQQLQVSELTAAELLEQAIRNIVREELAVHPGVHAFGDADEPAEAEAKTVRAFVNPDGEYRRATKRSRVRDGETEVMLTETEAKDAGLTG